MNIEVNGRVVLGFVLGGICGAVATVAIAAGPIGRIQRERDHALLVVNEQRTNIAQLQGFIAAAAQRQQPLAPAAASPQSQDPAVQVLNAVRPGLGTAAAAVATAVQKAQADKTAAQQAAGVAQCPAGSTPQTDPNWQGVRCVASDPQN